MKDKPVVMREAYRITYGKWRRTVRVNEWQTSSYWGSKSSGLIRRVVG